VLTDVLTDVEFVQIQCVLFIINQFNGGLLDS
jgi:hypothetical protein